MNHWRNWPTMPILLAASILGPGIDPHILADMPIVVAAAVATVYVTAWAVLAVATGIAGLWALDGALEFTGIGDHT